MVYQPSKGKLSDNTMDQYSYLLENIPKRKIWQLNISVLYDQERVRTIRKEIKLYFTENNINQIFKNILWDAFKAVIKDNQISNASPKKVRKK